MRVSLARRARLRDIAKLIGSKLSPCAGGPQGRFLSPVRRWAILVALVWLGLALRLYELRTPFLRWDEGWSIGLSSLGWGEINRITALDVHPPGYYYLFGLWLRLAKDTFWLRFFSIWWGTLAVPLAYVGGRRWAKNESVGLWTAVYVALAPFLVYYSQVARMYSLAIVGCLGATYFSLRAANSRRKGDWIAFLASGALALFTFYYSALVLAGLLLYLVATHHRRAGEVLVRFLVLALVYLPWMIYAWPALALRVGGRTSFQWAAIDALDFWREGFYALVFAYGVGWLLVRLASGLLALGLVLPVLRRQSVRELLLPGLAIMITLGGISLGAKAHMFAPRYMIVASPFLGLAIGWSLVQLQAVWRPLALAAALGFGLISLPTLSTAYAKPLEVVDPFDPHTFHRYVHEKARSQDIVFFNVLSTAGLYEHDRQNGDPLWSYVLSWDPAIEPLDRAIGDRILPATQSHRRLWFVLYKGTYAHNYDLKAWLDSHLYPAFAEWQQDTLYALYVSPAQELANASLEQARFAGPIELAGAAFTPASSPGGEVAVRLHWRATSRPERDYKVFVHVYAPDGRLVSQHDATPVNESRPTSSWQPGEEIADRHGIPLPLDLPPRLQLVVGLYDPATEERLVLPGGEDHLVLGTIQIVGV